MTAPLRPRRRRAPLGAEYGLGGGLSASPAITLGPRCTSATTPPRSRPQLAVRRLCQARHRRPLRPGLSRLRPDQNRIDRTGVFDDMSADPHGSHRLGGAKAGYLLPMGGPRRPDRRARLRPRQGRRLYRGRRRGADPQRQLADSKAFIGQLGLEAHTDLAAGGLPYPYIDRRSSTISAAGGPDHLFSQTSAPIIVNTGPSTAGSRRMGGCPAALSASCSATSAWMPRRLQHRPRQWRRSSAPRSG